MSSAREGAVRDLLEELERSVPGSTAALLTRSGSLNEAAAPAALEAEAEERASALVGGTEGREERFGTDLGSHRLGDGTSRVAARMRVRPPDGGPGARATCSRSGR